MNKLSVLKNNWEFKRLYTKGKFSANQYLVSYVFKTKREKNKIGITTTKKLGNAVKRNRARRIIRQAYRNLENSCACGYDIVFVARATIYDLKSYEVEAIMKKQFKKLGILIDKK